MVILGLGSNIGDRLGYLRAAVRWLSAIITDMRLSSIMESAAMLPPGATNDMDLPFLNMVISGVTSLAPHALLAEVKSIELKLGRIQRGVWGPREIDIDILAMDDVVIKSPELSIPHSGILKRDFVLLPLAEIAPQWKYPVAGPFYQQTPADIIAKQGYSLSDSLGHTGLSIHE